MVFAISIASFVFLISPSEPGEVGTPASLAINLARALSPMSVSAFAEGPIKTMPAVSQASTKAAFSDRKPYPGCMASTPISIATAIIFSILK